VVVADGAMLAVGPKHAASPATPSEGSCSNNETVFVVVAGKRQAMSWDCTQGPPTLTLCQWVQLLGARAGASRPLVTCLERHTTDLGDKLGPSYGASVVGRG
jgi:hypothetical protein